MTKSDNILNNSDWEPWTPNGGVVEGGEYVRLGLPQASHERYSNAQLDDYGPGRGLQWSPPLTLTIRARFNRPNGPSGGTSGFGFWNDPGGARTGKLRPPRALWFFHATPPNDLALDSLAPGQGWFAMTIDALRWPMLPLLAVAPLGLPLMWNSFLQRKLWPIAQSALSTRIAPIRGPLDSWRTYRIEWLPQRTRFFVDGIPVLDTPFSPHGPLGLVLWLDNQYAIVRPTGYIRGGVVDMPEANWLDIDSLVVECNR